MSAHILLSEVFPVNKKALSRLSAFKLVTSDNSSAAMIGGKLSYRLREDFGGHWVWTSNRILTDRSQSDVMSVVENLWNEQPDTYRSLRGVQPDDWQPDAQAQADFVARGLIGDVHRDIQTVLAENSADLGNARVERVYFVRGWVVDHEPAISISISSRLIFKKDLNGFVASAPGQDVEQLLNGLWVADKTSTLKGEIVRITGSAREQRSRLLKLTKREDMQTIIEKAPDDELVVELSAGRNAYEYVASALQIIVRSEDYRRFKINPKQALNTLQIEPGRRSGVVKSVSSILKNQNLIDNAYNSKNTPPCFSKGSDFIPNLRFGNDHVGPYSDNHVLSDLRAHGVYKKHPQFQTQ